MAIIHIILVILSCIGAYFLGSIPFSVVIGKLFTGKDLRNYNTRNPGAVNSVKTYGTGIGLTIMMLDVLKGTLGILIVDQIFSQSYFETIGTSNLYHTIIVIIVPMFLILGHNFSLWLKFDGGQGMGVFMGVLLYINPIIFCASGSLLIFLSGVFKLPGKYAGMSGVILGIPVALFLPIGPPWTTIYLDLNFGANGFFHLTQGLILAAMALALITSITKNLYLEQKRGVTNWFGRK